MARFALRQLAAIALTVAAPACSSTPTQDANASGAGAAGAAGSSGAAGAGGAGTAGANACPGPGYHVAEAPITLTSVSARITDAAHAPLAAVPVQVCGLDVCFNGTSDANGRADVAPGPGTSLMRPAYKYGDGLDYAKLTVLLPAAPSAQDLGTLVALALPSYAAGTAFPASGAFTAGAVTLTLQDGTLVEHDLLTYAPAQLVLRAVEIPLADSTQAVPASYGFSRAYALAPVATTFCPSAALSLPNSDGWAPGTAAEIFIQGLEVGEDYAQYGSWNKVADAAVSADGSRIDTQSGGIPILSSVAVRAK